MIRFWTEYTPRLILVDRRPLVDPPVIWPLVDLTPPISPEFRLWAASLSELQLNQRPNRCEVESCGFRVQELVGSLIAHFRVLLNLRFFFQGTLSSAGATIRRRRFGIEFESARTLRKHSTSIPRGSRFLIAEHSSALKLRFPFISRGFIRWRQLLLL